MAAMAATAAVAICRWLLAAGRALLVARGSLLPAGLGLAAACLPACRLQKSKLNFAKPVFRRLVPESTDTALLSATKRLPGARRSNEARVPPANQPAVDVCADLDVDPQGMRTTACIATRVGAYYGAV